MDSLVNIPRTEGFPLNAETLEVLEQSKQLVSDLFMGMGGVPTKTAVMVRWSFGLVHAVIADGRTGTNYSITHIVQGLYNPSLLADNPGRYALEDRSQYESMDKADGSNEVFENCIYRRKHAIVEVGTGGWRFIYLHDFLAEKLENKWINIPISVIDQTPEVISFDGKSYIKYNPTRRQVVVNLEVIPVDPVVPFIPYFIPLSLSNYMNMGTTENFVLNAVYLDLNSSYSVPCGCCYREGYIALTSPGDTYALNQNRAHFFISGVIQL